MLPPLPIWRCGAGHLRAVGSPHRARHLAGRDVRDVDPHRPAIDEVTFPCPECGEEARRVPEVIDTWYDSGAMPPAQWGYHPDLGRHRGVRAPLPRRLHLRGDRPDEGLVLHAHGRGSAAPTRPPTATSSASAHRRGRRQEDVEVARQHVRPVGRPRPSGRRCPAMVHDHQRLAGPPGASATRCSTTSCVSSC